MTDETRAQLYARAEFGCRYQPAYTYSGCGALAGAGGLCARHATVKCANCGDQATHECSYAGQFVCGAPLCADCEGWEDRTKAGGSWGFLNHRHRLKPAKQAERDMRTATAADFGLDPQL